MKKLMMMVGVAVASGTALAGTIAVKGYGSVDMRPDMVRISFEISAVDKSIKASRAKLKEESAKLEEMLKETAVSSNEVTMSDVRFSEESHYTDKEGTRIPYSYGRADAVYVFDGYCHSISVEIKFPLDMKRVETIYAALLEKELSGRADVTFYLSDSGAAKKEARRRAVENACNVAMHVCETAGVKLGKISHIRCSERRYDGIESVAACCLAMSDDGSEKVLPTIEVKNITVSDDVDIDWELEQ